VLLRNHAIERSFNIEGSGEVTSRTMYQGQYQEGVVSNLQLFAALFYSVGATNCSLFWSAKAGLDFSTFGYLEQVVWQERLSTRRIVETLVKSSNHFLSASADDPCNAFA
jgi:hypothetical protein